MPAQFTSDLRAGLGDLLRAPPPRTLEAFDIPAGMPLEQREVTLGGGRKGVICRITFGILTATEEKMALKRCGGDPTQLAFQLAIASLASITLEEDVNLPPLDKLAPDEVRQAVLSAIDVAPACQLQLGDGSADGAWNGMHPAMRNLCVSAYGEMQTAPEGAAQLFLKSRRRVR